MQLWNYRDHCAMYHSTIFYFIFHFSLLRICEYGHVFTGMQEEASELCSEHSLSVSKDPDLSITHWRIWSPSHFTITEATRSARIMNLLYESGRNRDPIAQGVLKECSFGLCGRLGLHTTRPSFPMWTGGKNDKENHQSVCM